MFVCRDGIYHHGQTSGTIFFHTPQKVTEPTSFINRLTARMENLAYNPLCRVPNSRTGQNFQTLVNMTLYSIQLSHTRATLQETLHDSKRHPKCFTVSVNNIDQNIFLNRLKPAFLDITWLNVDVPIIFPSYTLPRCAKTNYDTASGR